MSLSTRTRSLSGALSAAALLTTLALLPGPAGAVDATKPTPCEPEPLITDPAGDQDPGGPNQDITSVFLNFRDGVLTANLEITNLTKELPSSTDSQGGAYWYLFYSDGDTRRFVKAVNADGSTITYQYGTLDPDTGIFFTDGDTKGAFFEGPKGVVQIEIPAAAGAKAGASFIGLVATADDILGLDDFIGLNQNVDVAPDAGSVSTGSAGPPYKAIECPAAPATTAPPVTTPPTTTLPLKVTKVVDGAKKAKKKKTLSLKVTAGEAISNLSVSLKAKNGKGDSYASGKASQVSGTATLKLKVLKPKKLKAGTYALVAKGTVGGAVRKATLMVKVKK